MSSDARKSKRIEDKVVDKAGNGAVDKAVDKAGKDAVNITETSPYKSNPRFAPNI